LLNILVCKCEEKMLWPIKKLLDLVIWILKKKVILNEITVQCVIAIYIKGSCNITCALCSRAKVRGQMGNLDLPLNLRFPTLYLCLGLYSQPSVILDLCPRPVGSSAESKSLLDLGPPTPQKLLLQLNCGAWQEPIEYPRKTRDN
jgi:hypothetical protein